MFETLRYEEKDNVGIITFNRPENMNAFNHRMGEELERVTDQLNSNNSIRAVLLQGAGALFMAGGDILFFHNQLDTMPRGVRKVVRTLNASICNLTHLPKPVVASVHGSVAGVGMSFMMAADLVIAAENTKFTMAYSGLGISPDGGASFNLPRLVGLKKAMEWLLFSDLFDANTALSTGLLNWVVPQANLNEETQKIIQRLAKGPAESMSAIKHLLRQSLQNNLESQLELEGYFFEKCSATPDFKTGVTSFLAKKKPEFS